MPRRILITGISRFLGIRLARKLELVEEVDEIIGVDLDLPSEEFDRVEFVRADIRNPLFVKVLQASRADTVVHLNIIPSEAEKGRTMMKEMNVIGTMQLLAACQKSEFIRKVVVKSTTAVYGSEPEDPAFFAEEMSRRSTPRTSYCRDAMEIETYARDFGRRRPDVCLTILRFATILGSTVNNAFSRYLAQPFVPTVLGFDPRVQFIHEEDAAEALFIATTEDHPGIYNVAADGAVPLSQAIRRAGRIQLPILPPAIWLTERVSTVTPFFDLSPAIIREIAYGRVADNTRMKQELGFEPKYSCLDAVHDFREKKRAERIVREKTDSNWEKELREFVIRKQNERRADLTPT